MQERWLLIRKIIFADEPTGKSGFAYIQRGDGIDAEGGKGAEKKTLVMVTHDNHLASYADRIFHIIDGEIVKIEDNRTKGEEKEDEKD